MSRHKQRNKKSFDKDQIVLHPAIVRIDTNIRWTTLNKPYSKMKHVRKKERKKERKRQILLCYIYAITDNYTNHNFKLM